MNNRPEPVFKANAVAGLVIVLVKALLAVVVSMGWVDLSNDQQLLWVGLSVAVVDLVVIFTAAYVGRQQVTPIIDPRDEEGNELHVYHNIL